MKRIFDTTIWRPRLCTARYNILKSPAKKHGRGSPARPAARKKWRRRSSAAFLRLWPREASALGGPFRALPARAESFKLRPGPLALRGNFPVSLLRAKSGLRAFCARQYRAIPGGLPFNSSAVRGGRSGARGSLVQKKAPPLGEGAGFSSEPLRRSGQSWRRLPS